MSIAKLYMPGEVPDKINKIMRQIQLITDADNVVAMLASTSFWTIGPSVVATDKEIIYFNNTNGIMAKTKRFPFKGIGSIRLEQKGFSKKIVLGLSGAGEEEIDVIATPDDEEKFYHIILDLHGNSKPSSQPTQQTQHIDFADQIKKLADLKDAGILTEEEFSAKKQELLSKI